MRCLTLADALAKADARVTFVAATMPDALAGRIEASGHDLARISAVPGMHREAAKWEEPPLNPEEQAVDAQSTFGVAGAGDWVVVDHYLLDANWHRHARNFTENLLVIDDLANRSHDCDILLDQTLDRSIDDYREKVPSEANVLLGPSYALLRPEFSSQRQAALSRREDDQAAARRVLISMGTADPGLTARIVSRVQEAGAVTSIDLVMGAADPMLEHHRLGAKPPVALHVNTDCMAELMRDADVGVGAAGTSSWERCCLGLPTVTMVLADNQRLVASRLAAEGAVLVADSVECIGGLVNQLLTDVRARQSVAAAAAAITDGEGVERVVRAMFGHEQEPDEEVTLRAANADDSRIVWLWRNDPGTRRVSQMTAPIPWPDHKAWWQNVLESQDKRLLMAEAGGTAVAMLRFDRIERSDYEVSINVAPGVRGSGLGSRALAKACNAFRNDRPAVRLSAIIRRDNAASSRIFEKVGFVPSGAAGDPSFQRYLLFQGNE